MKTIKMRVYVDTAEKIKYLAKKKKGWSIADEIDALYNCSIMVKNQYTYQRVVEMMSSKVLGVGTKTRFVL